MLLHFWFKEISEVKQTLVYLLTPETDRFNPKFTVESLGKFASYNRFCGTSRRQDKLHKMTIIGNLKFIVEIYYLLFKIIRVISSAVV